MPQLSGAVHSIWWLGFFLTCSQILDLGHFSQIILPIVLQTICPTIRCCSQHLMVGVNFFLTSSPILDLGHFSQVILPIVLQIMPQPKNNPNHQVLWTASDGWVNFFFDLFSHSGLRAFFTSDFANCNYMPQPSGAVNSIWWLGLIFFLTSSPILDLGHFSQMILPIVLLPICPTIRCCSQHLMVGVNFFFDLFSHSGLRAFFTSDFANCTTNYAPAQK